MVNKSNAKDIASIFEQVQTCIEMRDHQIAGTPFVI